MPRSPKEEFRPFFLALQADCKSFPGGITAVAERVGVTKFTLANAINPDQLASSPPSLGVLLEIITRIPGESIRLFLELTRKASAALGAGALAAEDGRFDAAERQELEPLLRELLQATGDLIASLRSR